VTPLRRGTQPAPATVKATQTKSSEHALLAASRSVLMGTHGKDSGDPSIKSTSFNSIYNQRQWLGVVLNMCGGYLWLCI
jgi:hypothetical protein